MSRFGRRRLSIDELADGLYNHDRIVLSQAITLIESKLPGDQVLARALLDRVMPKTGHSFRVGITGVPGVGKSTFINVFGQALTAKGKKLAVLSIDPSSSITKGSILGDKTRMEDLSKDQNAYIRPSPTGSTLGGVATKTRETILLCEAAGYDVILVETVGVGQSETAVKEMVDFFLFMAITGGGDELQGIKRGIMEMADAIVINKAEGPNEPVAKRTRKSFLNALHLFPAHPANWTVPVVLCSALEKTGINTVMEVLEAYRKDMESSGYIAQIRGQQQLTWFESLVAERLQLDFFGNSANKEKLETIRARIIAGDLSVRGGLHAIFN